MDDNVKKELPLVGVVVLIIIILVIPILLGVYNREPSSIGFWGSYLGGIVGMIAVVTTTFILIRNQNKHHIMLLEEQSKQHEEQLEEQRLSIENSAKLSEEAEKAKTYVTFIFRQNEEILGIISQISRLYLERHNYILEIVAIQKDFSGIVKQQNFPEEESFILDNKEYIDRFEILFDKESEVRGDIIFLITELRIKSEYFELQQVEVFNFAHELQLFFAKLTLDMLNASCAPEEVLKKSVQHKFKMDKDLQMLLRIFSDELKRNLNNLK